MNSWKEIVIKKAFSGFNIGDVVRVEFTAEGIPCKAFWRARFKDAEKDNCIELKKPKPKAKKGGE